MATGLIQDLSTALKEEITGYLDRIMSMLFNVLEDGATQTDVKTIAIIAIGDLCLMSESEF